MTRIALCSLGRMLGWAATLAATCFVIFLILDLLPGDAASQQLGMKATPELLAARRHELGLDRPVLVRFVEWSTGVFRGDLGNVLASGQPVAAMISGPLGRSTSLMMLGLAGIAVLGVGGGIMAGVRAGSRIDKALSSGALSIICIPEFVIGTFLVLVFSTWLHVLPAVSLVPIGGSMLSRPAALVLPVMTLMLLGSAMLIRQVRALVTQQAERPHVEAARVAGLAEVTVLRSHLLPGAVVSIAQACAAVVPYLVGGTVIIERVFAFPGLGSVLISAVSNREPELLMGCVLIIVGLSLLAYTCADTLRRRGTK